MLFERIFFCFSLLHLVNPHLQINLHLTNWTIEDDNFQHDCLQVLLLIPKKNLIKPYHSSLEEIIHDYYYYNRY
jgi:hypothetical protein